MPRECWPVRRVGTTPPVNAECAVCEVSGRSDSHRSAHSAMMGAKMERETEYNAPSTKQSVEFIYRLGLTHFTRALVLRRVQLRSPSEDR